jgi:hypothetical protein
VPAKIIVFNAKTPEPYSESSVGSSMKKLIFLFFVLLFVSLPGCKKDSSNPADSNTVNYNVNGSWNGKTSQNEDISFRFEENLIREMNIKINVSGGSYGQHTSSILCGIENNSFSYSTTTQMGKFELAGNFKNSNSSAGTFKLGTTEGTWSASK